MHVLFIPSWYPLNSEDLNGCFFREQAHAVAAEGSKVGVIIPQFRSLRLGIHAFFNTFDFEFWNDCNINTYFKHNTFFFPKIPYIDQKRWIKDGMDLFELYIEKNGLPDIIHIQSIILAGPLTLKIHEKYNIPYCITEHSSTFARKLVSRWQYKELKPVIQNSSHCMAVSKSLCTLLESSFPGSQWEFIANPLDKIFLEEYSVDTPIKNTQFCSIANLNKNKAIDQLILAFSNLLKTYPQYTLIIAGDGPEREELEKLTKDLGIQLEVTFLGQVNRSQVRDIMAESFCFILPSHVETFGIVIIEALSQGTPVISTRSGGPESILTSSLDGILVNSNSPESLSKGMLTMIAEKQNFNRQDIRDRCISKYSKDVFLSKLYKVYKQCIK